MKIHESGENYLETILILQKKLGSVRSIDIVNELDYSKPSISRAIGILKKEGYVTVESGGNIILTDKGLEKANNIYERHLLLTRFLSDVLGVGTETAAQDACRIEHVISQESFDRMKEYMEKY